MRLFKLTDMDGNPLWINARTITQIRENMLRGNGIIHFGSKDWINVREPFVDLLFMLSED